MVSGLATGQRQRAGGEARKGLQCGGKQLPSLACVLMELHSLPRAPTLDRLFFMWAAQCSAAVGVAPFVPALPLLQKKACMISYMKDVCNWTAGPMRYIYNSKQNTLEPVSSISPPSLPRETYLHIFKYTRSKTRQNTGYRSRYTFKISHECGECL